MADLADGDTAPSPTVVVSHLDVTYRVLGAGRRGSASGQGESPALRRMLRRVRPGRRARPVGYREVPAVSDVSFVAHHGESIGIIGRNGSGKSTLLRAVAGLIPPTSGRLWVAGEPSLLGVNAVLMNKLSGERNIYIGGQALGLSTEQIRERFDDIVEFSGIGDAIYLPMGTYSSGMGARLRFAISTAAAPDVLMIDEALATGDAEFRERSAERIAQIREEAGTVFLVSHSNSNIRDICDRVLWMERGRLIMDGPTEQVLPEYEATLPRRTKGAAAQAREDDVAGVSRWGGNRLEAAATAVAQTYEGPVAGCFVVSTQRLAHARVAAPVAARLGWPLLWTRPSALPGTTRDQLARLQPERVVVVGGEELVSGATLASIAEVVPGEVTRVGDDDPSRTSAQLLRDHPPAPDAPVHLTLPTTDPNMLATTVPAGARGRAVLVSDAAAPDPQLLEVLRAAAPVELVVSGSPEEWDESALETLAAASGRPVRWARANGPMMRAAVTWRDHPAGGRALVAQVHSPVELLTCVAVGGATGEPLYLVRDDTIPELVVDEMARLRPSSVVVLGGTDTVRPAVRERLGRIVSGQDSRLAATASSAATKSGPPDAQS